MLKKLIRISARSSSDVVKINEREEEIGFYLSLSLPLISFSLTFSDEHSLSLSFSLSLDFTLSWQCRRGCLTEDYNIILNFTNFDISRSNFGQNIFCSFRTFELAVEARNSLRWEFSRTGRIAKELENFIPSSEVNNTLVGREKKPFKTVKKRLIAEWATLINKIVKMSNGDVTTTTEVLTSSPTTTPTSTASETSNPAMTKQSVSTETLVDTSHCNRCRNWWVVLGVAIEIRLGRERLAINKLICYIY